MRRKWAANQAHARTDRRRRRVARRSLHGARETSHHVPSRGFRETTHVNAKTSLRTSARFALRALLAGLALVASGTALAAPPGAGIFIAGDAGGNLTVYNQTG